uniref:hypothetical protein n=1 Tax=Ruegeria lacuscaerulensis TaxID=55218 RepID=UPI001BE4182A
MNFVELKVPRRYYMIGSSCPWLKSEKLSKIRDRYRLLGTAFAADVWLTILNARETGVLDNLTADLSEERSFEQSAANGRSEPMSLKKSFVFASWCSALSI